VNNEFERMWKEAVVAIFEILSYHLSGRTEETHKSFSQYNRSPARDLSRRPPKYKAEDGISRLRRNTCFLILYVL
jgi:hypothetical protein